MNFLQKIRYNNIFRTIVNFVLLGVNSVHTSIAVRKEAYLLTKKDLYDRIKKIKL